MSIETCGCKLAPIISFINMEVLNDSYLISLTNFKKQLVNIPMGALINCLRKHGFNGNFVMVNTDIHYSHKDLL